MPTTKSAKKRHRQSLELRSKNRATKSSVKTQIRKLREAVASGDHAKADTEFRTVAQKLDRAGAKRVIHPNVAARTKSRLQHMMRGLVGDILFFSPIFSLVILWGVLSSQRIHWLRVCYAGVRSRIPIPGAFHNEREEFLAAVRDAIQPRQAPGRSEA